MFDPVEDPDGLVDLVLQHVSPGSLQAADGVLGVIRAVAPDAGGEPFDVGDAGQAAFGDGPVHGSSSPATTRCRSTPSWRRVMPRPVR